MKTGSAAIVRRPWPARLRRPALLAVAAAAALLAANPAAAARKTPCDAVAPAAWGQLMLPAYHFSFLSGVRGRGAAAQYLYCVRNNHQRRGVEVDWRGAGLRSPIPPGETIFQSGPLGGRANARRLSPLYYGARWNLIQVMTLADAGALRWPAPRRDAGPLFRRAAWWQEPPPAAPDDEGLVITRSLVYVPDDVAFLGAFDRGTRSRAATTRWLESHPERLQPFTMEFESAVTVEPDGRVSIDYTCRYSVPSVNSDWVHFYLQFSDPALQRMMFNGATVPRALMGLEYGPPVASGSQPPVAPARLVTRTAELRILLPDRRTVIASIPVTWSAPAS
jgi:hypothetical protein